MMPYTIISAAFNSFTEETGIVITSVVIFIPAPACPAITYSIHNFFMRGVEPPTPTRTLRLFRRQRAFDFFILYLTCAACGRIHASPQPQPDSAYIHVSLNITDKYTFARMVL